MRRLPTKREILERAREIAMERQVVGMGVEPITPTEKELKETSVYREARLELMRNPETDALTQQHQYLSEMASELDLKVLEKKSWQLFQKKFGAYRWHIRGLRHLLKPQPTIPKVKKASTPKPRKVSLPKRKKHRKPSRILNILPKPKAKPKRKKRRKRHVSRTGKSMRRLRKRVKNGQKVFSFPDHVWKVRKK